MAARGSTPGQGALFAEHGEVAVSYAELMAREKVEKPAISKHIKVLERAGLVARSQRAQYRPCTLDATPLEVISTWAEQYRPIWESRFDRMDSYVHQLRAGERRPSRKDPT